MHQFFQKATYQNHPLRVLEEFLTQEKAHEQAKNYNAMRFVGYVLDIGYDTITIITADRFKLNVGGVPRNSLLISVPANLDDLPPHFTLLRVLEAAPTPLTKEVQQTYFELQKRSMPELDVFTQSELQWGALKTQVLGMFYPHPEKMNTVEFAGDLNNFVSAHKYRVYAPDDELLNLVVNSLVPDENRFGLGKLRLTECRLPLPDKPAPIVNVVISTKDFLANRTALFGKTRLGKSNLLKIIIQSIIETTKTKQNVGQLVFDADGEYANDNPQNLAIATVYPTLCQVYALMPKGNTPSQPLRLDFYEYPQRSHKILATLLKEAGKDNANYVTSFLSVDIPAVETLAQMAVNEEVRARRKILIYWAILYRAGYQTDLPKLTNLIKLDPNFNKAIREQLYGEDTATWPLITTLANLAQEFEKVAELNRLNKLTSSSGKPLFDADDEALLSFLKPASTTSSGPRLLQSFRQYHDAKAGDFVQTIISALDKGQTVILDLSNAPREVMNYFSEYLTRAIFYHQMDKFSHNQLGDHFIQLYFEEAHNLFPNRENEELDIYRTIAKEGAKCHIGMIYSTQSVTSINRDLLSQTENLFIAHLSSRDEVEALAKAHVPYESLKDDITQTKTPGYIRLLTRSHRFVISMQANLFAPVSKP